VTALAAGLVGSAALVALALVAFALRRSFAGLVVGVQLGALGLALGAVTLMSLTGESGATGQVIALVLLAGACAAAVLLLALHLAAARASRRAEDLEPW
jgi:NADH:ubiquinone oxidoreductase subunit K